MRDRTSVIMALVIGMVAGAGIVLAIVMKEQRTAHAEAPAPRFSVVYQQQVDDYTLLVLRDEKVQQEYLYYRDGLVLLGRGTNQ